MSATAVKLVVFDLDGVIYVGGQVLPHAAETVDSLRERGFYIGFFTNNSTRSREQYRDKLLNMGVTAESEEIMTSGEATRCYLKKKSPDGARVFIVGEEGLYEELAEFTLVGPEERETADYVVAGYDGEFTYQKMAYALDALIAGAELVATNRDATFPMPNGKILPGGGTIVAALECAWGREPFTVGKPNTFGLLRLIEKFSVSPEETLLVGDRADSDIICGNRAGVRTVLVLTGITRPEQVSSLSGELKPTFIIDHLGGLIPLLEKIAEDDYSSLPQAV